MLDFLTGVEPAYVTDDIPGIGGRLRAATEHFVVEEIPLYAPTDEGQHLYVRITKVGLTTKEVEKQLQTLFDLPNGAIGFAGMKDKNARTTQTFSLNVGHQPADFAQAAAQRIADNLPVTVKWARFHVNKLKPGHLIGNRFSILISDVEIPVEDAVAQAEKIVTQLQSMGAPNYFGPQRFGHGGGNVEKGRAVLQGKRSIRDKWLRRFLVSAYQSFLCNCYLNARVERQAFEQLLAGDVAKKYLTGGIFDVEDLAAEQARYAAHEISFTAPLYGAKMRAAHDDAGALEEEIFTAAEIDMAQLRRARVDGTRRLGRILLPDLTVQGLDSASSMLTGDSENDSPVTDAALTSAGDAAAVIVHFSLPKGAFATTVLREIMKVSLADLPDMDE